MKITYVVHQFLPRYFTGTEQYVFAISTEMQKRGHDVEIFSLEPFFGEADELFSIKEEEVAGLRVYRVRYWMQLDSDWQRLEYQHPYLGFRFGEHLETSQPDIVHFFHLRHLGANLIDECHRRDLPSATHLMDFWYLCPRVTLLRADDELCSGPPADAGACLDCFGIGRSSADGQAIRERADYQRQQLLRCDRIIAPSKFLKTVFAANGIPEERIEVIAYGIDPERLGDLRGGRPNRLPNAPLRIGFMGSIAPYKGTQLLVDAVLQTEGPLELQVYGRTSDFGEFGTDLEKKASSDSRIEFRGPFERDALGAVLSEMDVLVVPSRWYENTPFVVLEAFAGGVPVIATDLGGMSEIVADEVNGELFARDDTADLGCRLARLADEPARLIEYQKALPRVKEQAENAAELDLLYSSMLTSS